MAPPPPSTVLNLLPPSWATALLLLCLGCGHPPQNQPDLVLVDGLRDGAGPLQDAASLFRGELPSSGARHFTAAYTQSVEPHVGLGSLFTGSYPSAIPLCGLPILEDPKKRDDAGAPWCLELKDDTPTLAQVLGLYDYSSAFFSQVEPVHESVTSGFDHVEILESPEQLHDRALAWWRKKEPSPRLLVVQTPLDLKSLEPAIVKTDEGALALAWARERSRNLPITDPSRYRAPPGGHPEAWAQVQESYLTQAREKGREVAGLLDELEPGDNGARARWVIVTSLRGTSLREFSGTTHPEQIVPGRASLLLERTLHVPLTLFDGSDSAAVEQESPVELIDIMPTFQSLAGAVPPARAAGRDLLVAESQRPIAYAEYGDMLALRTGPNLGVFRAEHHGTSSLSPDLTRALAGAPGQRPSTWEVWDVTQDPLQESATSLVQAGEATRMKDTLREIRQSTAQPPPEILTPERVELLNRIHAEGYW